MGRRGVGRGWVAAGWVAAGGGDPPATHLDGNNGNEAVGARHAPSQRAQGSHMPFGAPPSANPLTLTCAPIPQKQFKSFKLEGGYP